jgi:hypothetical protein
MYVLLVLCVLFYLFLLLYPLLPFLAKDCALLLALLASNAADFLAYPSVEEPVTAWNDGFDEARAMAISLGINSVEKMEVMYRRSSGRNRGSVRLTTLRRCVMKK